MNTRVYFLACLLLPALSVHAAPGDLDTTFNGTGLTTIPFGSGSDGANSIAVQSDGKILVAGYSDNGSNRNIALMRLTSTGLLDTSFSGDGKVTADFGTDNDVGKSVAVQSDGKILVAGFSNTGSDSVFAVARFNSDGTPDTSFSGDGKATADFGGSSFDVGNAIAVQSDGKIVIAGYSDDGSDQDFAVVRFNSNGTLDTSFSSDGMVNAGFGSDEIGNSVALQSDGKILVAGYSSGGNGNFALVRYTSTGGLDTSFGGDGQIITDMSGNDIAVSVVVADGKILVAGYSDGGGSFDIAVARYTSTGALDPLFSGDGKVTTPVGSNSDYGMSMAVQSDGKILVAGSSYSGGSSDFALVRYTSAGALDTSFSGDGMVTTAIGSSNDSGLGVAVQADGKILVAGSYSNGSNNDIAVVRYLDKPYPPAVGLQNISGLTNTSVTLNGSVNPNGLATAAQFEYGLTPAYGSIAVAALSPNNGTTTQNVSATITGLTPGTVFYFRLTATNGDGTRSTSYLYFTTTGSSNLPGSLDLNLDADGIQTTAAGPADDFGSSVAVQSDGKIVVAGYSFNGTDNDFAVVRYTSNGALDSSFGTGGKVITSIGGDDYASSLVVQTDGKIVVAGYYFNGSNYDIVVVRHMTNGSLDGTFGNAGKVITHLNNYDDFATAVGLQTNGKIVVAGSSWNGSNNDVALVRYTTSGALDSGFGTGGKVITPVGSSDDGASGLAIQSDGKIVVAGGSSNGSNSDIAVVRYTGSGALDGSFGTGGKVTTPIGSSHDYGSSIVIQGDGKIVVAGTSWNGSTDDVALVRYTPSGGLDTGFGTGGKVTQNVNRHDYGNSIALQRDGKILVAGGASDEFANSSFALLRYSPDGVLDGTFGTQGIVTKRIHQTGWASSMALQSDGKIVVAGSSFYEFDYDIALARFNSDPIPPNVQTRSVAATFTTTATLTGTGNANGSAAMAWFEYGTTTSYGSSTTPQSIGSDASDIDVSAEINNLVPGTLYHYRLVVYNGMLTAYGENMSFTTATVQQGWRQLHFGTTGDAGNAADTFDFDNDGLPNLIEWACNLNPTTASVLPVLATRNGESFEFTYMRSVAALNTGVVFTVEWSDSMAANDWHTEGVTDTPLSDDGTEQQVRATIPSGVGGQRFVRLSVSGPP